MATKTSDYAHRIAGVTCTHAYALIGMFTRNLRAAPVTGTISADEKPQVDLPNQCYLSSDGMTRLSDGEGQENARRAAVMAPVLVGLAGCL